MKLAAKELDFELAAILRDELRELMKKTSKLDKDAKLKKDGKRK